jgi:methylaspartate mutase sigma subunit
MNPPRKIILGVTESDAHVVANHLICHLLKLAGFEVVNLGACTPAKEFIDVLAVVIGSLNGHAYDDLKPLQQYHDAGAIRWPVILGGNLSVGAHKQAQENRRFEALGVRHVLEGIDQLIPLLTALQDNPHFSDRKVG